MVGLADAREDWLPTAAQATSNLQGAELKLLEANAKFCMYRPNERRQLDVENSEWRERVERGCRPELAGADATTAATIDYPQETQCRADATIARAKRVLGTAKR